MLNRRTAVFVAALLSLLVVAVSPIQADATTEPAEQHCVFQVIGVKDGVLITAPPVCYATELEADRAVQGVIDPTAAFLGGQGVQPMSGSSLIGKHYTALSYGGATASIYGSTCTGGVWWPTGAWNNNIESSRHYCGGQPTTFYNYSDCQTSSKAIFANVTSLGWMNNLASCVRYG